MVPSCPMVRSVALSVESAKKVQVFALQQPGPPLAQMGQLRCISSVTFPRTWEITPLQPSQECFCPITVECGTILPLTL